MQSAFRLSNLLIVTILIALCATTEADAKSYCLTGIAKVGNGSKRYTYAIFNPNLVFEIIEFRIVDASGKSKDKEVIKWGTIEVVDKSEVKITWQDGTAGGFKLRGAKNGQVIMESHQTNRVGTLPPIQFAVKPAGLTQRQEEMVLKAATSVAQQLKTERILEELRQQMDEDTLEFQLKMIEIYSQ